MAIPDFADTIVIGGGAVGCGVAYSLARAGFQDVLLLERESSVAASTTSQAAGLVGQVRSTCDRTRLAMWSVQTFRDLSLSPNPPGWRQVGSLRVALTDDRVSEFERLKRVADQSGLEVEFLDVGRAQQMWPAMTFDRAKAILWCPSDGYLQPYDLTMSYVHHARDMGVQFRTRTIVTGIELRQGRVAGVVTRDGHIACRRVINAAGAHAYHIAKLVGLELPIVPVRHEYLVTVPIDGLNPNLPVVRIPDSTLYLRAETSALLCGGWEPKSMSLSPHEFPLAHHAPPIESDMSVLAAFMDLLSPEIPRAHDAGMRAVFKGWPTFTPDGRFIIGESRHVPGFVMAGGCNAHGVSGSAGIGQHVVESLLEEQPSEYVRSLSPDRFADVVGGLGRGAALGRTTIRNLLRGGRVVDMRRGVCV